MQFKVLNPITDGNGRHEIGDIIELNDKDAAEMLALKAVEPYRMPFGAENG